MSDLFNLVMLVCATVGSMAFGVLAAYAVFWLAFALMRPRSQQVAVKPQSEVATIP
jgi:ABC-type glycerol-3-phosphate transport system permease component